MTELIIFWRPNNGGIIQNVLTPSQETSILARGANLTGAGGISEPSSGNAQEGFAARNNPNTEVTPVDIGLIRPASQGPQGQRVDLYDDIPLPITYTIYDIREPDKKKTSWSKTITVPGTKNNNRIFNHIYELNKDGWMTIGSQSFYSGFNPNLRKEVVIVQDGVQVFKGNLQLKSAKKLYDGNVEYEVVVNGDLTSIFFDLGTSKLTDLDFSEFQHAWSKENITNSWFGVNKLKDGTTYTHTGNSMASVVSKIERDSNGRVKLTTVSSHGYTKYDFVAVNLSSAVLNSTQYSGYKSIYGVWSVADVSSSTTFSINLQYPTGLLSVGTQNVTSGHIIVYKQTSSGKGYVYPMVSWGDEYDQNSFPVVSFAPGLFIKDIWDKIMKITNSKYTSNFLNSEFFKRLILIEKKSSYELNSYEVAKRSFRVGTSATYLSDCCAIGGGISGGFAFTKNWFWAQTTSTASTPVPGGSSGALKVAFNLESGGMGNGVYYDGSYAGITTGEDNWLSDSSRWLVKETGEYEISASAIVSMLAKFGTYEDNGAAVTQESGKSYFPGTMIIQNSSNASSPLGQGNLGAAFRLAIIRERNGKKQSLGETVLNMPINTAQVWQGIGNPEGWVSFGNYSPSSWQNNTVVVNSSDKYFAAGDIVYCEAQYYIQAEPAVSQGFPATAPKRAILFYAFDPSGGTYAQKYRNINAQMILTISPPTFLKCAPSSKAVEGSSLTQTAYLPKDMTCKDFVTGIIKMFNLHVQAEPDSDKSYFIEPREDFYKDGSNTTDFVDWSGKVDWASVKITPMGELGAKTYKFEMKTETDYWNKRFQDERGRPYMQYSKTIQSDFLKNEYSVSLPFGSTVMINNPENSDVVMPAVHARENGIMKPLSQSAPRILMWMGPRPYTADGKQITINGNRNGWEFLSSAESVKAQNTQPYGQVLSTEAAIAASASDCFFYPYAGTVDSPNEPIWDINWYNQEEGDFVYWDSARWTNHNLYNAYWKGFVNEVSDPSSLVVEADFNLTPSDIANLDFRKIYVVDGIWYRLQKVTDYDAVGTSPTKVELLKVKSPTKFSRKGAWTGTEIVVDKNFDRVITTLEYSYAPPKKKVQSEGFANNINASLLSNASISVNGRGNSVAQSENVKVNGNENIVGHSSANIHITSGNGNFVSGGLENVTIIGTDKKIVRESNVSYINGVRYKNGVPISRASVIDGGLDISKTPSAPNTNINVVDASEDVVITRGSSTYEDVVDSGLDLILPDMAELGISGASVPKSKINFAPGYTLPIGPSQSLTDFVREGAQYSS